jgi:hypothetical protein
MRYISTGTLPKSLKLDQVLIHHRVPLSVDQPADGEGEGHGFRPYVIDNPNWKAFREQFEPCKCGWAGLPHYRPRG